MYENHQIKKAEKHVAVKEAATRALNKKIEQESAKDLPDEEAIKDLHRRINSISGRL